LAGGTNLADFAVINGGPMMGKLVTNFREPVTKTTKALLVLPKTNPVVQISSRPLAAVLRQAQAICCQCRFCTDLCPRNLLGYAIHPHQMILAASYQGRMQGSPLTEAYSCSECGACDLFACPMGLSPRRVNQAVKGELGRLNVKNPYKGSQAMVQSWRDYRRIPTKRLVSRLGLNHYESSPPLRIVDLFPNQVVIPLKQHIGIPARPVVKKGDRVENGQLIAVIPEEGKLSCNYHSSMAGWVGEINEAFIVIQAAQVQERGEC